MWSPCSECTTPKFEDASARAQEGLTRHATRDLGVATCLPVRGRLRHSPGADHDDPVRHWHGYRLYHLCHNDTAQQAAAWWGHAADGCGHLLPSSVLLSEVKLFHSSQKVLAQVLCCLENLIDVCNLRGTHNCRHFGYWQSVAGRLRALEFHAQICQVRRCAPVL